MAEAIRIHTAGDRRTAARLVHRATQPEHAAPGRRGGRLPLLADSYADDLPYWARVGGQPQLIVPYTLDANDMRFATAQGFNSRRPVLHLSKDSFDVL